MRRDELIEAMARGVMLGRHGGGCVVTDWTREAAENPHVAEAVNQATAALAAIEAAGAVVVPRVADARELRWSEDAEQSSSGPAAHIFRRKADAAEQIAAAIRDLKKRK